MTQDKSLWGVLPLSELDIHELHDELYPAVILYGDGYFDEAVRKASQRFINRVRERTGRLDLDGKAIIDQAFSSKDPLLEFSDRETSTERNEHDGFRYLAVGLACGLRNVLSHEDEYGLDPISALEWLAFISAMHRRLDDARQVASKRSETDAGG